jgi:hypothetical protein
MESASGTRTGVSDARADRDSVVPVAPADEAVVGWTGTVWLDLG